jgi:hypothetical protein
MNRFVSTMQHADEWRAYVPERLHTLAADLGRAREAVIFGASLSEDIEIVQDALCGIADEALEPRPLASLVAWLLTTRCHIGAATPLLARSAREVGSPALAGILLLVADELRALARDAKQHATALAAEAGAA